MTAETLNEIRSANYRAAERRREDAITWADVRSKIKECEDAVALLLKDVEGSEADDILAELEDLKSRAGRMQLECED
jgi:hypothetical protein